MNPAPPVTRTLMRAGSRDGRAREPDREPRAAVLVHRSDAAVVRLDEATRDRETEPGAAGAAGAVHLVAHLEDPVEVRFRDPTAGVDDRDDRLGLGARGLDRHRAVGRRVAD